MGRKKGINYWKILVIIGLPIFIIGLLSGFLLNIGCLFLTIGICALLVLIIQIKTKINFFLYPEIGTLTKSDSPFLLLHDIIILYYYHDFWTNDRNFTISKKINKNWPSFAGRGKN
jgi:hypothetical protein